MPELLDRLKQALADGYTIQRELGAGGMATVYLAQDLENSVAWRSLQELLRAKG